MEPTDGEEARDRAAPEAGESAEALDRPLPERVRGRVIQLAGEAFDGLTLNELPGPLRQYARFTPPRRVKFGGSAMAAALESDTFFRHRVGAVLRTGAPELAEAVERGAPPPAADPVEVAAAAFLLRPAGWSKLVAAAGEEAQRAQEERAGQERERELAELREELARAREGARDEQERLRAELEATRKESDALHRKLRSAHADVRRGEAAVRKLRAELDEVRASAESARVTSESEARRLRGRLARAEASLEASRRSVREERGIEDTRLRLLLDTVLDAAQGLRRELALPPAREGRLPAETVASVSPGEPGPGDIARRALDGEDPAVLDQLLALPQAHLVVDGYNVTKTGYPTMPLERQRARLMRGLAVLAAQSGAEMTCVFDGAELAAPVLLTPPRGVRVLFSPAGETADELIRQLVRAEPVGRPVVVVSSDREVAEGIARSGAWPVASRLLLNRLART
ncbi:Predicted RNA-binding protein containing a PIN domain [Streptomyces zhaozhouensis]|uniref:Predicted RNA-binding protein containing a PIN domain n=1 Tax=Streptomyces zhaozhouensis TaxID=1300267 RepID=A0A286DJD1_9ACTN|nr:NYN domain-containing protein [Streptomyces zhaozhouensis]SOD58778.1 Predicted RNA-binding protein containing a PIN domain [Streptomyces zhaozhouensis]